MHRGESILPNNRHVFEFRLDCGLLRQSVDRRVLRVAMARGRCAARAVRVRAADGARRTAARRFQRDRGRGGQRRARERCPRRAHESTTESRPARRDGTGDVEQTRRDGERGAAQSENIMYTSVKKKQPVEALFWN